MGVDTSPANNAVSFRENESGYRCKEKVLRFKIILDTSGNTCSNRDIIYIKVNCEAECVSRRRLFRSIHRGIPLQSTSRFLWLGYRILESSLIKRKVPVDTRKQYCKQDFT